MALAFNAGVPATACGKSRTAVFMFALGVALVCVSLVAFPKLSWVQLANYVSSRNWPVTQATVTSLDLREEPANLAEGSDRRLTLRVSYTYHVAGGSYEGARASLADMGELDDRRLMALYARLNFARVTGRTVPVFYDPDRPAEALIERSLEWRATFFCLAAAVVLLLAGIRVLHSAFPSPSTRFV